VRNTINYNDIINDRVKELILRYKKLRTQVHFEEILTVVDNLVLKIVHKSRKKAYYIKHISIADLYQTAIIALYKAIEKIPDDEDSNKIPAWISAYILADIRKTYHYLTRETFSTDKDPEYLGRLHSFYMFDQFMLFDVQDFFKRKIITSLEYESIKKHYFEGKRFSEIGKSENKRVKGSVVQNRIQRAFPKMRKDIIKRNSKALKLKARIR